MAETSFDLIVIGSGPAGYVGAIRAAQLGMKVAVAEKNATLGGTCLNVGCIPSKALLHSSELYHTAKESFEGHGIEATGLKADLGRMVRRKNETVKGITKGVEFLFEKNKITRFRGVATFTGKKDPYEVTVDGLALTAPRVLIATGSEPAPLPGLAFDGKKILSSTDALDLVTLPRKLTVIGGGVIAVEMGQVFARLGSEVTVVEYLDRLIPSMDAQLGEALQRSLGRLGMKFHFGVQVTGADLSGAGVAILGKNKADGTDVRFEGDLALLAAGRRPFTDRLGLEKIGLKTDAKGRVETGAHWETAAKGVYAVGDVIAGPMLAHKASDEAIACVETMRGGHGHFDVRLVPGVVYTHPEVAAVGETEDQLKARGVAYKSGNFPFRALGRARASDDTEGFIKILADAATDEVLGVHMIGPRASDLIAAAATAMTYRASAEDVASICTAHPTFAEGFREAGLAATANRALHI